MAWQPVSAPPGKAAYVPAPYGPAVSKPYFTPAAPAKTSAPVSSATTKALVTPGLQQLASKPYAVPVVSQPSYVPPAVPIASMKPATLSQTAQIVSPALIPLASQPYGVPTVITPTVAPPKAFPVPTVPVVSPLAKEIVVPTLITPKPVTISPIGAMPPVVSILDTIPMAAQTVVKPSDWAEDADLKELEALATGKPVTRAVTPTWTPTAILTKPWEQPVTTITELQGYVSAKEYHDSVVAQLPGLDTETQDLITRIAGFSNIQPKDIGGFLLTAGFNRKTVTAPEILQKYTEVKQIAKQFVEQAGTILKIQVFAPAAVTDKESMDKLEAALNKAHPEGAGTLINHDLAHDYPELAVTVYLGVNKYEDALAYMQALKDVQLGGGKKSIASMFMSVLTGEEAAEEVGWVNASLLQKRAKLAEILSSGLSHNINKELIARTINNFIFKNTNPDEREDLIVYVKGGGLQSDANLKQVGDPINAAWRYITSPEGSDIIGLVAVGAAVVGGALVGGIPGAIAGAGMSPFLAMEIKNYVGYGDLRIKQDLELRNMYPPNSDFVHSEKKRDISDKMSSLEFDSKNLALDQINIRKAAIQKQIDAEKADIENDAILLIAAGTYIDRKNEILALEEQLKNYNPKTVITNPATGLPQEVPTDTALNQKIWSEGVPVSITAPKGITYKLVGAGVPSDPKYLVAHAPGKQTVEFYEGDKLITTKTQDFWDPYETKLITISQSEIDKAKSFLPGEAVPIEQFKRTVFVPAGVTLQVGTKVIPPIGTDRTMDITAVKGHKTSIKLTAPDKEEYVTDLNFLGAAWDFVTPIMKEKFVPYTGPTTPGKVIFTGLPSNARVKIDGVEVSTANLKGYSGPPGRDKSIVVDVEVPGFEPRHVPVWIKAGEIQEVSLAPTKEEFVPYQPEEFGGGGGGGGEAYAPAPTPTTGQFIFGETVRGAQIWLDNTEVAPEIGKAYDLSGGYHSVVVKKTGFKDYTKTVYIIPGESQTFSPALEVAPTGIAPVTPALPAGYGGIRFGEMVRDATITIDGVAVAPVVGTTYNIAAGYHAVTVKKSGKQDYSRTLYVLQDQTIEFSPLLEDVAPTPTPPVVAPTPKTYRVTFTSKPEGAKIMIGKYESDVQDFTGQWTPGYVDLLPGLYKLRLYRSGYVDVVTPLWIGPISMQGEAALAAARAAGVI